MEYYDQLAAAETAEKRKIDHTRMVYHKLARVCMDRCVKKGYTGVSEEENTCVSSCEAHLFKRGLSNYLKYFG